MFLVVDKEKGPYTSIADAVANAKDYTEIRISSGLYSDNVEITKHGLRLVPKDKEADIIWVANAGPAITVNIPDQDKEQGKVQGKVFMNNLKLAHTAIDVYQKDKNTKQEQAEMILHAFASENQDRGVLDDKDPNMSYGKTLDVHDKMNTLIYVKSGGIEITVRFV
jgi:hypothetical protein